MKQLFKLKQVMGSAALSLVVAATPTLGAIAAPDAARPADRQPVSGPQAKPPVEPGKVDAKVEKSQGATNLVATDDKGTPKTAAPSLTAQFGAVANVDFGTPLNYCYRNLVYTPVTNTTAATKYIQVRLYNDTGYRDIYTSIAANSTAYPAFYGVDGAYTAYLYVWNGSSYQYDEYKTGTNTCNVSVTRVYNSGGWVQLKIQNLGTAYATQISTELAPYPGSGTYTGTQYDYPVAGGAALYRWFNVGTQPYGITSQTYGSFNYPYYFTGDL